MTIIVVKKFWLFDAVASLVLDPAECNDGGPNFLVFIQTNKVTWNCILYFIGL